ncbi:unknown protein [Nostoc sp. NIES-3756]|jgi:hypothetical protein|uniref:hypothetical protein n=1 Tax=Nostoc sp. NIES-3756 TaxID=1751286 RepID=UPI000720BC8E|nr:hypothetical protein [Nostoc sp. NIES-3756]BAT51322.1 unknown protein [Nostoc sp. NIES-3756]
MLSEVTTQSKIVDKGNNQVTHTETQQPKTQPNNINLPDIAISLSPLGLVFSWVIFFVILRKVRSVIENKMVFTVKGSHHLPCKNCQFYSHNHYLKCAVQPCVVMTEEAKNCSEYLPKKDSFDSKHFF